MIAVDQFRREFLFKKRGHCKRPRQGDGRGRYHRTTPWRRGRGACLPS